MRFFTELLKSYVIPVVWTFVIAIPIMGIQRAIFAGVFIMIGLLIYNFFKKKSRNNTDAETFSQIKKKLSGIITYGYPGILAAVIIIPLFLNSYDMDILTSALLYSMLALGLNLLVGDMGLLNLGYIAFYGIGAYTYAILATKLGVGFWISIWVGGIASALIGLIIAIPTLRLKGDYFAIVTLGFGEIIRIILNNWNSLTNGPNGIMNIPRPLLFNLSFDSGLNFYYLVLCFLLLQVYLLYRIKKSRFGRYSVAIRENESASEMIGLNAYSIKLIFFMVSAFFGGIAGVLFASKLRFISPDSFTFIESIYVLAMVILGGMGNIPGVIVGAFALVVIPELLRSFVVYRMLIFALLLITIMLFRPEGLLGKKGYGR
ncbi:MAG: branched-chain amino acid ABC transporter permease [Deltaproteobacteria bacterium]|nr:branched-chain amino acid ABC transporter permease [Deltaproteobacteria bacterium]MCL5793039.1 branched-chain amino acid ABC transporter permease [Deltaproteobacteria bacterium]